MTHRLTVLGTGYLGVTHAACMASLGYDVLGMDVDEEKVARLSAGELPFYEPGLEPILRKAIESGHLSFTTSYADAGAFGDVHFICVGTPQQAASNAADMRYVDSVVDGIAAHLRPGSHVVGKSTVPVGTAERIAARLAHVGPADVELSWNPEFLREGFAVEDTLRPDRLVFGVQPGGSAESVLREVFAPVVELADCPIVVMDLASAQLVKVAANAFLATKISFINAMAEVCEATGADVKKLSEALSHDTRIGGRFLHAGLGFGGGCLPKDIRAFMARAEELGVEQALSFLSEVDAINLRRRARMVDLAREQVGGDFTGKRVGVLGAAFKPNSDDIRDSPALDVAATILGEGAEVTVYDPAAVDNARRKHPELAFATSAVEAARDADVLLHLTEWTEFKDMDPAGLHDVVRVKHIVDGRNALDPARWRAAGWTYRALGRP
ncbi:MAG TPA: UDP-glucose/GDP-mannose dehydrogenase family protein [Mycobacteriales bacterium]|nr:UDP-glucose/GDP-mannose dehydrogenase family protein [Mycobacteriales bacterium]